MKKLILILLIINNLQAQKLSSNGRVFTPKGDLKALVVFVLFSDNPATNPNFKNSENYYEGWTDRKSVV